MKKIWKRALALVLTVIMTVPALSGCGSKEEKPITLTIYTQLANYSGEMMGWSAQVMREKFNVIINIIPNTDGIFETRMESGNLGDIVIFGSDGADYQLAVRSGMLYDWEAENLLHEHGPYIEEHMVNALERNRQMEVNDGHLYGFGSNVASTTEDHDMFIYTWDLRWDLYRELGYPEYRTLDDFIEVLTDMKEICPTDDHGNETYAVSIWPDWDVNMVMYVKSMASAYYGYDEFYMGLYDSGTGEFYGAMDEDGPYIDCLRFFNKLYQRNLLDPNSMTQTMGEAGEKVRNGGTFFSIFNYAGYLQYNESHQEEDKMMLSWMPSDATPIVEGLSTLGSNRIWTIGANTEYPELCMEIINWFCTPEGTMTYYYGPQGLCWDYDEEGHTYFTEFGHTAYFDQETMMIGDYEGTGTYKDGMFQHNNSTWTMMADNPDSNGERYSYQSWRSEQLPAANELEQDWRDRTGATDPQDYMNQRPCQVVPITAYQEASRDDVLDMTWSAVADIIKTYSWRAMYARTDQEFEEIVATMIEEANNYGYAQCLEWCEEQARIRRQCELDVLQ